MARSEFAFLHVHSWYSPRTGVASVPELVERAAHLGYGALALTDYCSLAGVPEFVYQCRCRNVKPIIGTEVPVAFPTPEGASTERLVLLAEDDKGYANLSSLLTSLFVESEIDFPAVFTGKFSVPLEKLATYATGVIVLLGGTSSKFSELVQNADWETAQHYLTALRRLFDLQHICIAVEHVRLASSHRDFARRHGLIAVAAPSVHYLAVADRLVHLFLSGQPCPTLFSPKAPPEDLSFHHLGRHEEVEKYFQKDIELLAASIRIADRCRALQSTFQPLFPSLDLPRISSDAYLSDIVSREAENRFKNVTHEIRTRLDSELAAVHREGLADRLILLHALVRYCRENGVTVGVGTSDLATSLIAYVLGLTRVDPLRFKLNFSGFGNIRIAGSAETLTVELPTDAAPVVMRFFHEYIRGSSCARIGRYLTASRTQIQRQVCEWMALDAHSASAVEVGERDGLRHFGSFVKHSLDSITLPNPQVLAFVLSRLLGRPQDLTFSETDLAIYGRNLAQLVPLVRSDGQVCTQVAGHALDVFRVPRLVLSASQQLKVLDIAARWVREEGNFDIDQIQLDDPRTHELLRRGFTLGIEPFQSMHMRKLLRQESPRNFRELLKIRSEDAFATGDSRDIRHFIPESLLAYYLAYIKAHFPACFFAALFSRVSLQKQARRLAAFFREAREMGVRILGPDINRSHYQFTIEHGAVRCGLCMIKGVGEKTYREIEQARSRGEFESLDDLRRRTERRIVNNVALLNLIRSGACDCFGEDRDSLVAALENAELGAAEATDSLFSETLRETGEVSLQKIVWQEMEATDVPISVDPLVLFSHVIKRSRAVRFDSLSRRDVEREVALVGYINHIDEHPIKEGGIETFCADFDGYPLYIPTKVRQAYETNLSADEPLYVWGVVHWDSDEALAVRARAIFTLTQVEELSNAVAGISLDLRGENFHTLRLVRSIVRRYKKGKTRLRLHPDSNGFLMRFATWSLNRLRLYFCPGLYYQLQKVLLDKQIELVFEDNSSEEYALRLLAPFQYAKKSSSGQLQAIGLSR